MTGDMLLMFILSAIEDQVTILYYADVTMGGQPAGRIKMELFADVCPKTCENFRQLCTGEFR